MRCTETLSRWSAYDDHFSSYVNINLFLYKKLNHRF